jgi:hypothetical protein
MLEYGGDKGIYIVLVNLPSGLEIGLVFSGSPSSRVTNSSLQVTFGDLL